jgi:hypothetical protein
LCVAGDACAAVERAEDVVLAAAGVEGGAGADDGVLPDVAGTAVVDGTTDVEGTAAIDGPAELVAGVVPIRPAVPPLVVDAQPASPSAAANKPIPS